MNYYKQPYTNAVALIADTYIIKANRCLLVAYDKGEMYYNTTLAEILENWNPCTQDDFNDTYSETLNNLLKYAKI